MEKTEKLMKENTKKTRIWRRISMLGVALLAGIICTTSGSWITSQKVIAVGGIPVITNAVSKEDIENAKKKRDEARTQAKKAASMVEDLKDQKSDLQGELKKLNAANEEQRA